MHSLDISLMAGVMITAHVDLERQCDDMMIKMRKALYEISSVSLPEKNDFFYYRYDDLIIIELQNWQ